MRADGRFLTLQEPSFQPLQKIIIHILTNTVNPLSCDFQESFSQAVSCKRTWEAARQVVPMGDTQLRAPACTRARSMGARKEGGDKGGGDKAAAAAAEDATNTNFADDGMLVVSSPERRHHKVGEHAHARPPSTPASNAPQPPVHTRLRQARQYASTSITSAASIGSFT